MNRIMKSGLYILKAIFGVDFLKMAEQPILTRKIKLFSILSKII